MRNSKKTSPNTMTLKVPFMTRIDAELRQRVKKAARRQNRTVNNFVETMLLRELGLELPITEPEEVDIGFPEN
jgi:predicted HicB family RNase H-like nuclease